MNNKYRNEELLKERFKELINYGSDGKAPMNENKLENSTLIEYKKAGDGRLYGIVKENQDYFIKTATPFKGKTPDVSDFVYINGLQNKVDFKYNQLNETQKTLNSKLKTINEAYGFVEEDEFNPEEEENQPLPAPSPSPEGGEPLPEPSAPSPEGEGMPAPSSEPAPEGGEPMPEPSPAPTPEGMPSPEGEESDPINKAKSHIGKAGNYIKNSQVAPEMTKQLASMFLGYLDLATLPEEEKQALVDKIYNKEIEEDVDIELVDDDASIDDESENMFEGFEMTEDIAPDAETITAILSGIAAVFGGSYAVDKLMSVLKKKNPDIANKIESLGSAAGKSIMGGTRKFDESKDVVVDDEKNSEEMIKEYAKKYNVSEQVIINTVHKFLKEGKVAEAKKLNQLKEEKVRMAINNIIKEKLGLKKKMIKEGKETKLRVVLEKAVDQYLKKVNLDKKK